MGILNGGTLALMTSIGHQTGLFETLAALPPSTSRQIADVAGLNERYVREWLNTVATGKIVTYATENGTYALPAEHAAVLTKAAGPGNMAAFARIIPILDPHPTEVARAGHPAAPEHEHADEDEQE